MTSKEEFLSVAANIKREGISDLLDYLDGTDFYTAPASAMYHENSDGGLVRHSLHVYYNMKKLADIFYPELNDTDGLYILSLFHDISKVGFYEKYMRNKKVTQPNGRSEWIQEQSLKVKDATDRDLICGEHGVNSFMILNRFMNLTEAEASAIINHHAGMDNGFCMKDLNECFNRYPELTLLHLADMVSCYIDENPYKMS